MGRRLGSKNKKGHKSGGKRANAGAKRIVKDAPGTFLRMHQQTLQQSMLRPPAADNGDDGRGLTLAAENDICDSLSAKQQTTMLVTPRLVDPDALRRKQQKNEELWRVMLEKLRASTADGSLDLALACLPCTEDDDSNDDGCHAGCSYNGCTSSSDHCDTDMEEEQYNDDNFNSCADDTQEAQQQDTSGKQGIPSNSYAYKPPKGSCLYTMLKSIKDIVKMDTSSANKNTATYKSVYSFGQHWIAPELQTSILCKPTNPGPWYLEETHVFVWLPFLQFPNMTQLGKCRCVHCGAGNLEPHEYDWRPMFYFDRIVWVIHRRFRCKEPNCRKSVASIDPRLLSQLPDRVSERFPFVSAGNRYLGMHKHMIYSFVELITSGVQFASFAKAMNTLYAVKFDTARLSYYKSFLDYKSKKNPCTCPEYPEPFSGFQEVGQYNGIRLSKNNVRAVFLQFMRIHEPYMQATFQTKSDEGTSADHTFKYSSVISASGRHGKVFGASYTVASLLGNIVMSRLVFTKSSREINGLIGDYKKVRENSGAGALKIFHTDNVNGDGGVWMKHFPELQEGVTPLVRLIDPSLPLASLPSDAYTFMTSCDAANTWAMAVTNSLLDTTMRQGSSSLLIGVDCEWNVGDDTATTRLLQVSLPGQPVGVFHLSAMGVSDESNFPDMLKKLLQLPQLRACGVQIGGDLARLQKLGVSIEKRIELQQLALVHDPNQENGTSLEALCRRYLQKNVNKNGQCDDYSQEPLPTKLVEYAALDAMLSRQLADTMLALVSRTKQNFDERGSVYEAPSNHQLLKGDKVDLMIGGKNVATAALVYVGGINGESRMFRNTFLIGKGKALIKLVEVLLPAARLPFPKSHANNWPKGVSVGWVSAHDEDKVIAVQTSNLVVAIKDAEQQISESTGNAGGVGLSAFEVCRQISIENVAAEQDTRSTPIPNVVKHAKKTGMHNVSQEEREDELDVPQQAEDDEAEKCIRTRQHEDLWHQFHGIPLAKTCEIRAAVMRLLIHGTYQFVQEDYEGLAKVLTKKGVRPEELIDHFHFNREYWRKRVRMPTFEPDAHSSNISKVHKFIRENSFTKTFYTTELKQFFDTFQRKCLDGRFSELHDVNMYRRVGIDADGLDLWIRLKGSVRCENIHKVMRSAMGQWGVGATVAHYLLVLISHKYNVNAGIKRNAAINFGHSYHYLIDQLQIVVQRIYNVVVYPRHCNITLFRPVKDFVAVGIGPLNYSQEYVANGEPMEHMTGDMRFIAQRMKVQCPPLEPAGKEELAIINRYFASQPRQTQASLKALAKIFLEKANGKTIFPKLVSQLKAYGRTWMRNSVIKSAMLQMGRESYSHLLQSLASWRTTADTLHQEEVPTHPQTMAGICRKETLGNDPEQPMAMYLVQQANPTQGHHYVPSITTPYQQGTVPTTIVNEEEGSSQQKRRCVYFPLCEKQARICFGNRRGACRFIKESMADVPPWNILCAMKRKRLNQEKSQRKRDFLKTAAASSSQETI